MHAAADPAEAGTRLGRPAFTLMALLTKRSVVIAGRKTSVSLEQEFWSALKAIAAGRGVTASELVGIVDAGRQHSNLSSALRLFVLGHFREQAARAATSPRRTVLVVDDDPLVRDMTASMLADLGCQVVSAANGTEALEKLSTHSPIGMMITDINMPGLDGYELAERARRQRPDLEVILLSGRETDGRGLPLIRKPFLQADLMRLMQQAGNRA
jgi:CheY-like chemotaxis protein